MREPAPDDTVPSNRRTGRTTAMIYAARHVHAQGVEVIAVGHTTECARELAGHIGCRGYASIDSIGDRLRGSRAVPFVDHYAVEVWAADTSRMRAELHEMSVRLVALRGDLNDTKAALVRETDRRYAATSDAEKWRARCPVTAADVEREGVSAEQCEAFLLANGGEHYQELVLLPLRPEHGINRYASDFNLTGLEGQSLLVVYEAIAKACTVYARWSGTPAQDVLESMRKTAVG